MIVFKEVLALQKHLEQQPKKGKFVGFVPTMGALHEGHISLILRCKEENDICVCSIFVNPTQFNDPKDFEKYPVSIGDDILKLEQSGCAILLLLSVKEMYPAGTASSHTFDLGHLETILEGKFRPGHFQGVCQVVERLLKIVMPTRIYMGQKDYQQVMVIRRLIELMNIDVQLAVASTRREPSGLAMSSRNLRLTEQQREQATAIFKSLKKIQLQARQVPVDKLVSQTTEELLKAGFHKVDYVAIADATTLEPATEWIAGKEYVALVAAFIGEVRLIDNLLLQDE